MLLEHKATLHHCTSRRPGVAQRLVDLGPQHAKRVREEHQPEILAPLEASLVVYILARAARLRVAVERQLALAHGAKRAPLVSALEDQSIEARRYELEEVPVQQQVILSVARSMRRQKLAQVLGLSQQAPPGATP